MTVSSFDIHSHLNDPRFDPDLPDVLARMRAANVATIVVGTDLLMSKRAIALAEENSDIWATVGLHPTDNHNEQFDPATYAQLAAHPRVVAIGECGLDYHWPAHDGWPSGEREEKARQHELFRAQIAVAQSTKKPLMIHGRPTAGTMDAYNDILDILSDFPEISGDVHFFVGDIGIARRFLDIGFILSFTGVVTFTHDYDEVIRYVPADRIMAETDAPYVAPVPYRGKRNEPAYVREVIATIAAIRNDNAERFAAVAVANAVRLFGFK
jgi:TatD DNase family protein